MPAKTELVNAPELLLGDNDTTSFYFFCVLFKYNLFQNC